jgi:hypothetical protein
MRVLFLAALAALTVGLTSTDAARLAEQSLLKAMVRSRLAQQRASRAGGAVNNTSSDATLGTTLGATYPSIVPSDPATCPQTAKTTRLTGGLDDGFPTRRMWGWTEDTGIESMGYCGETSFQVSLQKYGGYFSAEWVRYADGNAELLIGVNDEQAASSMGLNYQVWDGFKASAEDFLSGFVKPFIKANQPVTMGFYIAETGGDNDYDHIMSITGFDEDASGKVVGIYYNDWCSKTQQRHLCRYTSGTTVNKFFIASRSTCTGTPPSLCAKMNYCIPSGSQYAIAITSAKAAGDAQVFLRPSQTSEPDWGAEDKLHQTPVAQNFNVEITGMDVGAKYRLLRFDSPEAYKAAASNPKSGSFSWSQDVNGGNAVTDSTATVTVSLMSDGRFYFVVVKV